MKFKSKLIAATLVVAIFMGIIPITSMFATDITPANASLVGTSVGFGFNAEPTWGGAQLPVNGVLVGAWRYSAFLGLAEYEAFCVNPDRPGPEQNAPPYVINRARPELVHILRYGHPNNARMTQSSTDYYYPSDYAAYMTRTALVYRSAQPGAVLGGDPASFIRQTVSALANGTSSWQTAEMFAPSRQIRINGVENAANVGTLDGGMVVSDVFSVTNSHANNPLKFRWWDSTPNGTQIMDADNGTVLATFPNLPSDNSFQIMNFRLAVPSNADVENAGVDIVGFHDEFAGQVWAARTTINEQRYQEMVFYIPKMLASASVWPPADSGQFRILKTNMQNVPLDGAIFRITGPDPQMPMEVNVPASGWTSPELILGTYTVTEIVPPAEHIISATPTQTVTITAGQTETVTLTFRNPPPPEIPDPRPNMVRIQKICALGRYNIGGALMRLRGISSHQVVTGDGQIFELDNTGINLSQVLTAGATTAVPDGVISTVTNGVWTLEGLPFGAYIVEEERAPDGYSLLPQHTSYGFWLLPPNVIIDADGRAITCPETGNVLEIIEDYRIIPHPESGAVNSILLTFENFPFSEIIAYKHCGVTNMPLSGAHIRIEGFYVEGNAPVITDRTYVTDSRGRVVFRGLPAGNYTISEVQPPPGFSLSEPNFQSVNVSWGQREGNNARPAPVVRFFNVPRSSLEILKICGDNGTPLSGAIFELRDPTSGETWTTTSGANGIATFGRGSSGNELRPNHTYILREIQAPQGFVLITRPQGVVLSPGNNNRVTVRNYRNPSLTIIKRCRDTQERLQGAVFSVEYENGQTVSGSPFTTNDSGEIVLPRTLFEGDTERTLIITEVEPPRGFVLSSPNWQRVTMRQGENNVVIFLNSRRPAILIRKVDADNSAPLEGVEFLITNRTTRQQFARRTDSMGIIRIDDVYSGWWDIRELNPKPGYLPDNTIHQVYARPGEVAEITITNRIRPSLRIIKFDAATMTRIPNTTFNVYRNAVLFGTFTTDSNGEIVLNHLEPGTYLVREVAANPDYVINSTPQQIEIREDSRDTAVLVFLNYLRPGIHLVKLDRETMRPLPNAKFRISQIGGTFEGEFITDINGEISLTHLEPGAYQVVELIAPDGFLIDNAVRTIQINPGENAVFVFTNTRRPSLEIIKYDPLRNIYLPGATFRITRIADGTHYLDRVTDQNGRIIINNLEPGVYSVREIAPPSNYVLNDTLFLVELFPGETSTLVVINELKPSLQIIKTNAITGERLQGASFTVRRVDGETITTVTTDENGEALLEYLDPGVYEVIEVSVPPGFLLDNTPQHITLVPNRTGRVPIKDKFSAPYSISLQRPLYSYFPVLAVFVNATDFDTVNKFVDNRSVKLVNTLVLCNNSFFVFGCFLPVAKFFNVAFYQQYPFLNTCDFIFNIAFKFRKLLV